MSTVILIILIVLAVLIVGGMVGRALQTRRSAGAFDAALARVDHDLAEAAAEDRGWDRALLEQVARSAARERHGAEPDELTLVEVLDRPGTDADEAVFRVRVAGAAHRLGLGRREGEWVAPGR
jgi:Tfp pilus assembly protein PilX